jgi:hypothetical protein
VHTKGEFVHSLLLHAHIIDANLGVWHTPAESWLRIRLVLDLPIAPCWAYKGKVSNPKPQACHTWLSGTTQKERSFRK